MMRYDSEHKERTRRRLLSEAAATLRIEGPERVALAGLMGKLGLTHGGFYAHFKSKEDLVEQAIDEMFDEALKGFRIRTEGLAPKDGLLRYVDLYLTLSHVMSPGDGCALPALAGDVSRMASPARQRFAAGAARLHSAVAGLVGQMGPDQEAAMEIASSLFCEMAGAIALARVLDTPEQAERTLSRSRASIRRRIDAVTGNKASDC